MLQPQAAAQGLANTNNKNKEKIYEEKQPPFPPLM